ncbi:MAG TPA: hypothetical protein VHY34_01035, partial [Caulobacteraceae bacterium]|nr:hypothetical protein [Caulobacteraceae bacterium]
LDLVFANEQGQALTLGKAVAHRPTVLVFADYTCTYLCGPALVLTAAALDQTRLRPGRDYSFVVLGFNPRDGPSTARVMRSRRLAPTGAGGAVQLLSDGPTDRAAAALGYRYVYDAQHGQYAHDAAIYVLAPDGSVRSLLPEIALTPAALTQAIDQAKGSPQPVLSEPLRLICYCLQPLTGAYDGPAVLALRAGGVAMLAALGLGALALHRRREQRP